MGANQPQCVIASSEMTLAILGKELVKVIVATS